MCNIQNVNIQYTAGNFDLGNVILVSFSVLVDFRKKCCSSSAGSLAVVVLVRE